MGNRKIRGKQVAAAKERLQRVIDEFFVNNPQAPKQNERNSTKGYKRPGKVR